MSFDAYEAEKTRQTVFNFCLFDESALSSLKSDLALSLPIEALLLCRDHFRFFERRDPTVGDLRFLDALATLWDGMPDTAIVEAPRFCEDEHARVFSDMLQKASALPAAPRHLPFLMDLAGLYLSRCGMAPHHEDLRCAIPTELAALCGANGAPSLSLELGGAAAMLAAAPVASPFPKRSICLLLPTGNAPFANEAARFFAQYRGMGLSPVAVPADEGLFPHLLSLGGATLDVSSFAEYRPDVGAASLLQLYKDAVLFLAPEAALPHLLTGDAPIVCCGLLEPSDRFRIYRRGELILSLSTRLLLALRPCRRADPTVGARNEKEIDRGFVVSSDTALGGAVAEGGCEQTLLSLIGELHDRGADLSKATATAVLELPPMQPQTLSQALPLILDYHRVLTELALPACHHRQLIRKDLTAPRLSVFIAAKNDAKSDTDFAAKWHSAAKTRDFAALRALLYPCV